MVLGGWLYESADGTMVVGRSCRGAEPPVSEPAVDVEGVDVSESVLLVLAELCDPVSAGCDEDELLLGARFNDFVLAYQYGLVVAVDEEESEELLGEDDE